MNSDNEEKRDPYIFRKESTQVPKSWDVKKYEEVTTLEYGNNLPKKDRVEGGYPVYGSNGVTGWHNEFHIEPPGIIVGRKGTLEAKWSDDRFNVIDTAYYISEDCIKSGKIDLEYLFYNLNAFDFQVLESGSAVPSLSRDDFYNETVALPPIDEQRKIATILRTIDEKIEVNNRIDKVLKEMAQAIFKSWFVDFDQYDGEVEYDEDFERDIPVSWDKVSLDSIADFLNGKAWQNYSSENDRENDLPVVKIKELRNGITEDSDRVNKSKSPENYILHDGNVVFSWSASLVLELWSDGEAFLNQHLFKVTSHEHPRWLFYLWIDHHIRVFRHIAEAKKTTMGHIKRSDLKEAKVLIPSEDEVENISKKMKPIFEERVKSKIENRKLEQLRDTLLPKLMSGEIRVNDIELDELEVDSEV